MVEMGKGKAKPQSSVPSFQTCHIFSTKHESLCNRHMLGKKLEMSYYKAELYLSCLFCFKCL